MGKKPNFEIRFGFNSDTFTAVLIFTLLSAFSQVDPPHFFHFSCPFLFFCLLGI